MILPNPAIVQVTTLAQDPVTEDFDESATVQKVMINPRVVTDESGAYLVWDDNEGFISSRELAGPNMELNGGDYTATTMNGSTYLLRAVDPRDAITMSPAGVPQPVDAIKAALLGGGSMAQELDAVVADDNTVVTLMLETSVGTYVRYSGDWQLLTPDSTSLENLSLIAVGPGAIDVYDGSEAARTTVSVFDLPVPSKRDGEVSMDEPDDLPVDTESVDGEPVTAAGALIPMIASVMDLDMGLRFAAVHPGARWYVSKRAKALGVSERIPASWNVVLVR